MVRRFRPTELDRSLGLLIFGITALTLSVFAILNYVTTWGWIDTASIFMVGWFFGAFFVWCIKKAADKHKEKEGLLAQR